MGWEESMDIITNVQYTSDYAKMTYIASGEVVVVYWDIDIKLILKNVRPSHPIANPPNLHNCQLLF